jgi:hypothetical protein
MLEKLAAFGGSEDFITNIRGWRRNFELDELIEGTGIFSGWSQATHS